MMILPPASRYFEYAVLLSRVISKRLAVVLCTTGIAAGSVVMEI